MKSTPAINFTPSAKQYTALSYLMDHETEYVGYGGSAFSGKSYLLAYWLTIMCYAYPGTGWGLCRRELTNLKKTTLLTLFKVFAECGIKVNVHYVYNQQLNLITFTNGSQIFLIDTAYKPADPLYSRLGGFELTGLGIDESAETQSMAIEILYSRTGRRMNAHYGLTRKVLETFNPVKNHVYERYYLPYKTKKTKPRHTFIPALPTDNPSPEVGPYVEGILATGSKVTIERLIHGNFEYDDDPAALISYEAIMSVFTNVQVPDDGAYYITVDVARKGQDRTVIIVWKGWRAKHIVSYEQNTIPQVVDAIKKLQVAHQVPAFRVVVDEDGVGGGVVDSIVGCLGFVNNSSPVPVRQKDGFLIVENFKNLKSQCYYKFAQLVNEGGVYIEASIDHLTHDMIVADLEMVKQKDIDKDGKISVLGKEEIKERLSRSPDFSDALMMRMYIDLKPNEHYIL